MHRPHPAPDRDSPPPMCIRHDASPAVQTSAPVEITWRILSANIAIDVSAFFTANVPPNPQHCSAAGNSTNSSPRTARSNRTGRSATRNIRNE
ncbi:hypothetical protein GCM10029963_01600 [Micromonospora andamanensis]